MGEMERKKSGRERLENISEVASAVPLAIRVHYFVKSRKDREQELEKSMKPQSHSAFLESWRLQGLLLLCLQNGNFSSSALTVMADVFQRLQFCSISSSPISNPDKNTHVKELTPCPTYEFVEGPTSGHKLPDKAVVMKTHNFRCQKCVQLHL